MFTMRSDRFNAIHRTYIRTFRTQTSSIKFCHFWTVYIWKRITLHLISGSLRRLAARVNAWYYKWYILNSSPSDSLTTVIITRRGITLFNHLAKCPYVDLHDSQVTGLQTTNSARSAEHIEMCRCVFVIIIVSNETFCQPINGWRWSFIVINIARLLIMDVIGQASDRRMF